MNDSRKKESKTHCITHQLNLVNAPLADTRAEYCLVVLGNKKRRQMQQAPHPPSAISLSLVIAGRQDEILTNLKSFGDLT